MCGTDARAVAAQKRAACVFTHSGESRSSRDRVNASQQAGQ
jgi:hypothetical protein